MSNAAAATTEPVPDVLAAPHPVPRLRRRVLVTGASGMLGCDVAPVLAGAGFEVFARPRSDLDITRPVEVSAAFHDVRPQVVVNCAAFTRVDEAETDPRAFDVNARGVRLLAEACLRHSAQLVQISTDFVFDGCKESPYVEEDTANPLGAYGRSKREGEEASLSAPATLIVRSSWLFGRGGWNFVEAILKQIENGKRRLTVVNDQWGRPTATPDLADAILALLQAGAVGTYHFANRGEATWFDFAQEIVAIFGQRGVAVEPIEFPTLGRPARRPAYSVLDTSKYERATGRPIRHFREALVEYLARRARPEA